MGLDYGEAWHRDPIYRRESFVAMAKALNLEYPQLRLGGDPDSIVGGLSQIDSCAFMAALFGQEIQFSSEGWPVNTGTLINDYQAEVLEVPAFENHPVYRDLLRQMDIIEQEWGTVEGELNYQGVLNTAFRLRGEKIFTDMLLAPRRAHRVLSIVCETTMQVVEAVYDRQARTGIQKDYFVTSNCVVNMISEQQYREFIMPYDRMLSAHFPNFGIHNCGWTVDVYLGAYADIGSLGYLDFGIKSNLSRIKELFPSTILTVILNPDDILEKDQPALEKTLQKLHDIIGRCRIILGSLDGLTPSQAVSDLFDTASGVWGIPAETLVPVPHCG
jgi:uroporphyrinogen-III decarboxylase